MKNFKKLFAVILCALSVFLFAACSNTGNLPMPNPFVDCKDMKAAAKISGFSMTAPETAGSYEKTLIQAIEKSLVQVIYSQGENSITIRKGSGAKQDVSGDYNTYSVNSSCKVDGTTVTVKGASSDTLSVATWSNGKYSYSITASGVTLTQNEIAALVKTVK